MEGRLRREIHKRGRRPASLEVTLVGRRLMPQHAEGVRHIFEGMLEQRGIKTILGTSIAYATPTHLHCSDGSTIQYDEAIWCTAAGAQKWLYETTLALDPGGFIAVHPTLESINTAGVFASGDVAAVLEHPRPKAGVFAVRQGMPLTNNLRRALRAEPLVPFIPQASFLGLIGGGDVATCVASRGLLAYEAPWLWTLKDWIDRTWMNEVAWVLPAGANTIRPRLTNIRRLVAVTTHGSSKFVNALQGEPGKRTISRSIRVMCNKFCRARWIGLYGIDTSTLEQRKKHLATIGQRVARALR